mmetsp:Transcript_22521/g.62549  ORF Transcript_22521/g.62549 Transcript_22521/m.62549 type:complete len:680 (-) Transcript_22521:149-2188(-)|eukprot:CAMPEP_0168727696 /NCGR_PEP_ID=MMETSP0724-20121128/5307_1 /TAXON_ID=265536 /ORGANISM="Amphiprora sp., Strain CCMP467" /LENGTH=679 /DNA_ID=CAMNT_0008774529 /DNA_START=161 /DNA_END=2200 /DNA_ORIENTATION=+
MSSDNENRLIDTARFSPGIMMIFVTYVASVSATIGDLRAAAEGKNFRGVRASTSSQNSNIPVVHDVIRKSAMQAIGIFVLTVIGSAVLITLLSDPLDERMVHILNGLSRISSSVTLAVLSVRVALWLNLYQSYKRINNHHDQKLKKLMGTTAIELQHAVRWSVAKVFLRPFCILLVLFQEGTDPVTIPVSIIAGVSTGLFVDFVIYKCRRFHGRLRKALSIAFVGVICFFSLTGLVFGTYFIAEVWDDETADEDSTVADSLWPLWALLIGLATLPFLHVVTWQYCKFISKQIASLHGDGISSELSTHQRRMATSMFLSRRRKLIDDDDKEEESENGGPAPLDPINEEGNTEIVGASPEQPKTGEDNEAKDKHVTMTMSTEEGDVVDVDEVPSTVAINNDDENDDDLEEEDAPPTMRELWMDWKCCGCVRGREKTRVQKAVTFSVWFFYLMLCFICLYILVANMGSTYQQEWARDKLPFVFEKLYRYIDEGPVCAFDNRGADSNITTFPDKDAAHDAGFLVLHCGACGACSDWHNLELEYTTRDFLALESRKCAQKSLLGGGQDKLESCLSEPQIGFQGQCAVCWAEDIICTRKHCTYIALQSFLINTLANFEVGEDTITAAACEEAHCEAGNPGHFVSCSGATRRRMNVTSSIKRPGAQQCSIVDVDWAELFPDPHPNA